MERNEIEGEQEGEETEGARNEGRREEGRTNERRSVDRCDGYIGEVSSYSFGLVHSVVRERCVLPVGTRRKERERAGEGAVEERQMGTSSSQKERNHKKEDRMLLTIQHRDS